MTAIQDNSKLTRVVDTIRAHADEWRAMKVTHVYVFGSLARGDHRPDSDIDLLVEMERPFSLFDLGGVWSYFEDLFGPRIDVVERSCLRSEFKDEVDREAVLAA